MKWTLLEGRGRIPSKTVHLNKTASRFLWHGLGFHCCPWDLETRHRRRWARGGGRWWQRRLMGISPSSSCVVTGG